jgi:hypothetical protein
MSSSGATGVVRAGARARIEALPVSDHVPDFAIPLSAAS